MERYSFPPSELAAEQRQQIEQLDYWARMGIVADLQLGPSLQDEVNKTLIIPQQLQTKPSEIRASWLRKWASGQHAALTEKFDASGDEGGWSEGQHILLENYKHGLTRLGLVTSDDFERFNQKYDEDTLFRARYEGRSSDAMRWSPENDESTD